MLAPGRTRAAAQQAGAGAAHPDLGPNRPAMTDWGRAKWSETKPSAEKPPLSFVYLLNQKDWNDPLFICDPAGYPRTGGGFTLYRFVQLPNEVVEFFERDHVWRDLWTDGRKLPGDDAKPRWYGYSIAHWEGDTFVVESDHFDDRTWVDRSGSIHSDQMRLEERYKRLDHDHMEFSMTLIDPKAYTAPWVSDKKQLMVLLDTSDGIPPDVWGKKSDGTPYGDIREDFCVYSQEYSFWTNQNPTGVGNNFGNSKSATDQK
ncbi:MAG: hypothetical protein WCA19_11650 [Candidatus Acidiferrales bacterium]